MKIAKFMARLFPDLHSWLVALPDTRVKERCRYPMDQVVMSVITMLICRHRSLRAFCRENRHSEWAKQNFRRWLGFSDVPSDDAIRYILNDLATNNVNQLLVQLHGGVERKKILDDEKFLDNLELVAVDGSGQFSSKDLCCDKCLVKNYQTGQTIFFHAQLVAALTNKGGTYALPLYFEPIENDVKQDEYFKNDCELNACKRLISELKRHYPKRSFCFLGDNLFAVTPITDLIRTKGWHFIFTAKPDRNKELFSWYEYLKDQRVTTEQIDKDGIKKIYCFQNQLPLTQSTDMNKETVNMVEYREVNPQGISLYYNTWITNIEVTHGNVKHIAEGGRSRFPAIENRIFNEQKNRGYQTEHNFGHFGNLPNVFFGLAQIAHFLTELFKLWREGRKAIEAVGSIRRYFERLATHVSVALIEDDGETINYLKFDFGNTS